MGRSPGRPRSAAGIQGSSDEENAAVLLCNKKFQLTVVNIMALSCSAASLAEMMATCQTMKALDLKVDIICLSDPHLEARSPHRAPPEVPGEAAPRGGQRRAFRAREGAPLDGGPRDEDLSGGDGTEAVLPL